MNLRNTALLATTALISFVPSIAQAQTVINGMETTQQVLTNGEDITVTATGDISVSAGTGAINVGAGIASPFITNNGTITNTGGEGIEISGTGGPGGEVDGAIINTGDIIGSTNGITLGQFSGFDSLDNSGTISGGTGSGISIAPISGPGTITNSGDITGVTGLSFANSIPDIILNGGTIEGTGGTAITLDAGGSSTDIIINGGRIIGDITTVGTPSSTSFIVNSDFTTEGNISLRDLTVNSGASLTISSNDLIALSDDDPFGDGALVFEVDNAGDAGFINVQGSLNLTDINIEVDADGVTSLADGQAIQIGLGAIGGVPMQPPLLGTDGTSFQTLTQVTDNSSLFDFLIADGSQTEITGSTSSNNLFLLVSNPQTSVDIIGNETAAQVLVNNQDITIASTGDLNVNSGSGAINVGTGVRTPFITNNGTITNTGGAGVELESNGTVLGQLTNTGTITGSTSGVLAGSGTNFNGGIENSGEITGATSGINLTAANASAINNTGTITGGIGEGVLVEDSSLTTLTNDGTIIGDIGIFSIGDGIENVFLNGGVVEGTSGLAISSRNSIDTVTFNGGRIIGDVIDSVPTPDLSFVVNSDFTTEGNIDVGNLAINNGSRFTISAGNRVSRLADTDIGSGTLVFGIDAAGTAGQLNTIDNNLNLTGLDVEVEVDQSASFTDGQEIQIGVGDLFSGAVVGTDGTNNQTLTQITDNSVLFNFAIADGSQTEIMGSSQENVLFLLVSEAATLASQGLTENTQSSAAVLDELVRTATISGDLQDVFDNVTATTTAEEFDEALESLLPSVVDGGTFIASSNVVGSAFRITGNRLSSIRGGTISGISSGDLVEGVKIWAQPFAQRINQTGRGGVDGFDATTYGVVVGVDSEEIIEDTTLGLALAYANTDVDSDNANATNTDINSYQVALYGDHDLDEGRYISGVASYTFGDNDGTRFNVGGTGLNANGDFDSNQYAIQLEAGQSYQTGQLNDVKVTPKVLAYYSYYDADDFTETGAGGANLSVDNDGLHVFELGVGVDASWDIKQENGGSLVPEIRAAYRYDFVGDAVESTAQFTGGGSSFSTEGAAPAQSTVNLGEAITYDTPNNWSYTANYDFEYKSDQVSNAGFVRAAYQF